MKSWITCVLFLLLLTSQTLYAAESRVLPEGTLPNDVRLKPLKDLDGYFPFAASKTRDAWNARSERVRRQMLVSLGLWPMPSKTPLNAVIHGKIEMPDYSVEKVYFESVPGFFVTGNLYRPKGKSGRLPGFLSAHGHWNEGRFVDIGPDQIKKEIASGAERFPDSGRSLLQARAVHLARMGCVVFHYDMIGYADSQQLSYELAHLFKTQRPHLNTAQNWGLFSPQAESHLQSVMGLQTWNSIRALDFLQSLPEVDPSRIGATGESGGGTQTILISAVDSRVTLSVPAVMASTAMQGGCTCENASLLRIDSGNIEFCALFAPKPQGLLAADDWTRELATKGFPDLQNHYTLLGVPNDVHMKGLIQFQHNYNLPNRLALYEWVNRYFKLRLPEPIEERDFRRLTTAEMSVWNEKHPKPSGGEDFERKLLAWWTTESQKQLSPGLKSMTQFRELYGKPMEIILGRTLAEISSVQFGLSNKVDMGNHIQMGGLLHHQAHQEQVPVIFLFPKEWKNRTVIWLTEQGKRGLFDTAGLPIPEVKKLLDAGATVMGLDLLYQGEFSSDQKAMTETPKVKNPREAASYTFGYNRALFAQRVDDVLSAVSFVQNHERKSRHIDLVGLDSMASIAVAARTAAGDAITSLAVKGGFRFIHVNNIRDPFFLPGGSKYGDLPGMLALGAPGRTWISGETRESLGLALQVYAMAKAKNGITLSDGKNLTEWLLAE